MDITVDTDLCMRSGTCVAVAPRAFDQDADGVSRVIGEPVSVDKQVAAREAVDSCPVAAISVVGSIQS